MSLIKVKGRGAENLGRRNIVINGAMQVVQRGTVSSLTGSSYGGPDRFRLGLSGAGTHRILQSATVPSGSGFANSWRLDCTTADTSITSSNQLSAQYKFEGQDLQQLKKGTPSAEKLTLSFWVRSSVTGTYVVELSDKDNTRHIAKTYTISQADTFEYKTLTFDGDTTGALDSDNARSMQITWWLAAGDVYTSGTLATSWASDVAANRAAGLNVNLASSTDNNWYLTGVQLEIGETATPFEHRSFGDELFRCQRYLYRLEIDSAEVGFINLTGWNTNDAYGPILYPVEMRSAPTLSYGASLIDFLLLSASSNPAPSNIYNNGSAKRMMELGFSSTGNIVAGRSYWARITDPTNGFIQWDAEL